MSWFDANDYFIIETTARDRVEDLGAGGEAETDLPAPLFRMDRARRIDEVIDYFGESLPRALQSSSAGGASAS